MINMNSDLFSGGTSTGATTTVYEEISEEIYEGPPDFSAVIKTISDSTTWKCVRAKY